MRYGHVSMNVTMMQRLRLYHAVLAMSTILAYLSGEMGLVHAWFGYGVAAIILFRLGWALSGARLLGLQRFYPVFTGLKLGNIFTHPAISRTLLLGIALSLIGVTATGIAIDRGRAFGQGLVNNAAVVVAVTNAHADESEDESGGQGEDEDGENESSLGELHETLANLLLIFVATHVAYLLTFKRPLALFMLFLKTPGARAKADSSQ